MPTRGTYKSEIGSQPTMCQVHTGAYVSLHSCLRQKHIQSEIGSQPTMCQVRPGAYVSLLAPGKTDYTACHPGKTTTYILDVVPITTHTHNRRKSIGKKNKENVRRERKGKERKKAKNEKQEKTRKARRDKTRRGSKERKREKTSY